MAHDHGARGANERNPWIVLGLTATFMLAEVAGGVLTRSLALISDAAHMFTDSAALAGLAVNFAGMRILRAGSETSLNVKGAYLEVWADMLGSLGVIGAAIVIYFTGWAWVDALVAVGLGLWVLPRTWKLLRESLNILLEGVPDELALHDIEHALLAAPGVQAIHDLHVWALTSGKNSLTVHLVVRAGAAGEQVLGAAAKMLEERFRLTHTTIQVEAAPCEQELAHEADPRRGRGLACRPPASPA